MTLPDSIKEEFKDDYLLDNDPDNPKNFRNHEQGLAAQKTFSEAGAASTKTSRKWEIHSLMIFQR